MDSTSDVTDACGRYITGDSADAEADSQSQRCGDIAAGGHRAARHVRDCVPIAAALTLGIALPAVAADFDALLTVWEASVRATHDFMSEADIDRVRPVVRDALPSVPHLVCVRGPDGRPIGFVGAGEGTVYMLFVDPALRGRRIGRALLEHAVAAFGARALDVNEENPAALGFYRRLGWEVIGRSPLDHTGMLHPIVHMRLRLDEV